MSAIVFNAYPAKDFQQVDNKLNEKEFFTLTEQLLATETVLIQAKLPLTLDFNAINEKAVALLAEANNRKTQATGIETIASLFGFGSIAGQENLVSSLNKAAEIRKNWLTYANADNKNEYVLRTVYAKTGRFFPLVIRRFYSDQEILNSENTKKV